MAETEPLRLLTDEERIRVCGQFTGSRVADVDDVAMTADEGPCGGRTVVRLLAVEAELADLRERVAARGTCMDRAPAVFAAGPPRSCDLLAGHEGAHTDGVASWTYNEPPGASELREHLAAVEHERWAHWQRYLHSRCTRAGDGALIIPGELVERWERQIATGYADLSEAEQASDLEQVDRYWPLIAPMLAENARLRALLSDPEFRASEALKARRRAGTPGMEALGG